MFARQESKEYAEVKVSVLMITYNQEEYIAQAIDSALHQEVDFNYEIVVGDDCSTDSTKTVLRDYQQKHSERIRLLLHKQNLGFSGKKNLVQTLRACEGKYVAILEGDDYWISPHKLQKQADFLDKHDRCTVCFHDVVRLNEDGSEQPWLFPGKKRRMFALEDLVAGNFIPTCSTMFRNKLFSVFPEWYYQVPMGDWPLHIINSQYGDVGYIDEVMGVYRVHSGGHWSPKSRIDVLNDTIVAAEKMKRVLSRKHRRIIEGSIITWYLEMIKLFTCEEDYNRGSAYAKKCLKRLVAHRPVPNSTLLRLVLIGYFPILYKFLPDKLQ